MRTSTSATRDQASATQSQVALASSPGLRGGGDEAKEVRYCEVGLTPPPRPSTDVSNA